METLRVKDQLCIYFLITENTPESSHASAGMNGVDMFK